MPILEDLYFELTNDAAITAITTNQRIFYKNPQTVPSDPYIVYSRNTKTRDMVTQFDRFQIACFSKDMAELETLANAVITLFEDKRSMNGNEYYSIFLINQTDSDVKLQEGFYFSILTFEFRSNT